ncbi:MAG: arylesterase [Verrucomicrobiota bacterium]
MSKNNIPFSITNRRRWVASFVAVALGLAIAMATSRTEANTQAVVFYGDSLTAAFGIDPSLGYPALLQEKIEDAGLANEFTVVSSAVSGETSKGGLKRLNWALKGVSRSHEDLGLFMLALGANDGLRGHSVDAMTSNLNAILKQVRNQFPGARLVVAGMLMPPNLGEDYRTRFRDAFIEVAEANNATLIPFLLEGVAGRPELNLPDQMHPNEKGQKVMADNLWPVIEPLLVEKRKEQGSDQ